MKVNDDRIVFFSVNQFAITHCSLLLHVFLSLCTFLVDFVKYDARIDHGTAFCLGDANMSNAASVPGG